MLWCSFLGFVVHGAPVHLSPTNVNIHCHDLARVFVPQIMGVIFLSSPRGSGVTERVKCKFRIDGARRETNLNVSHTPPVNLELFSQPAGKARAPESSVRLGFIFMFGKSSSDILRHEGYVVVTGVGVVVCAKGVFLLRQIMLIAFRANVVGVWFCAMNRESTRCDGCEKAL